MPSVRARFRSRPFWSYVLLAYGFSWAWWLPNSAGLLAEPLATLSTVFGVFGPAVAALVVTWGRGDSVREWASQITRVRVPARWYLAALGIPAVAIVVASLVHVLAFDGRFDLAALPPLRDYPLYFVVVLLVGGGLEEPGWRGFALPTLQRRYGALFASALIGVVWAVWHLPLFVTPETVQASIPFLPYAVGVVFLSITFTWLVNSTGGSVLIAIVFHTAVNVSLNYYPAGGETALFSTTVFSLLVAAEVAVAVIIVAAYDRKTLARRARHTIGTDRGGLAGASGEHAAETGR